MHYGGAVAFAVERDLAELRRAQRQEELEKAAQAMTSPPGAMNDAAALARMSDAGHALGFAGFEYEGGG
jgi:elongation factor P--beta-lysine ligase